MTPKEAFKIGFLQKCAADGLTQEETLRRIVHAKFMLKTSGFGSSSLAALKASAGHLGGAGVGAAGGAGYGALTGGSPVTGGLIGAGIGGALGFGVLKALLMLAPPLAGIGAGAVLAKVQDDTYDKDEARKREEISEYRRAVERLQRLQSRQATTGMV